MEVRLVSLKDEECCTIRSYPFKIGKSPFADLCISRFSLSHIHCVIREEDSGEISITDMSSKGTYINGELLGKRNSRNLKHGDQIKLCIFDVASWVLLMEDVQSTRQHSRNSAGRGSSVNSGLGSSIPSSSRRLHSDGDDAVPRKRRRTEDHNYCEQSNGSARNGPDGQRSNQDDGESKKVMELMRSRLKELEEEKNKLSSELNVTKRAYKAVTQNCETINAANEELRAKLNNLQQSTSGEHSRRAAGTSGKSIVQVQTLEDAIQNEFTCPVCAELMIEPVTLNCSHAFCKFCMDQWKANSNTNCPSCRTEVTSCNRTLVMDNFIERIADSLSADFKTRRAEMIADRKKAQDEFALKQTQLDRFRSANTTWTLFSYSGDSDESSSSESESSFSESDTTSFFSSTSSSRASSDYDS